MFNKYAHFHTVTQIIFLVTEKISVHDNRLEETTCSGGECPFQFLHFKKIELLFM